MNLRNYKELNEDEQDLFDLLICSGLEQIIPIAKSKFYKENDVETFLSFLVEVQNLLEKLGYDFKFQIKENRKYEV